jgi:hypothetical protein
MKAIFDFLKKRKEEKLKTAKHSELQDHWLFIHKNMLHEMGQKLSKECTETHERVKQAKADLEYIKRSLDSDSI